MLSTRVCRWTATSLATTHIEIAEDPKQPVAQTQCIEIPRQFCVGRCWRKGERTISARCFVPSKDKISPQRTEQQCRMQFSNSCFSIFILLWHHFQFLKLHLYLRRGRFSILPFFDAVKVRIRSAQCSVAPQRRRTKTTCLTCVQQASVRADKV